MEKWTQESLMEWLEKTITKRSAEFDKRYRIEVRETWRQEIAAGKPPTGYHFDREVPPAPQFLGPIQELPAAPTAETTELDTFTVIVAGAKI